MLLDEASLAGTLALDQITAHAAEVVAKIVLIGDWAQLSALETGGAPYDATAAERINDTTARFRITRSGPTPAVDCPVGSTS